MVELLLRGLPFEDAETLAVVLGVAARAIRVAFRAVYHSPVHGFAIAHEGPDLPVAGQAFQLRRARAEDVTTGALQRTVQRVVGLGQRSRGYLSVDAKSDKQYKSAQKAGEAVRRCQGRSLAAGRVPNLDPPVPAKKEGTIAEHTGFSRFAIDLDVAAALRHGAQHHRKPKPGPPVPTVPAPQIDCSTGTKPSFRVPRNCPPIRRLALGENHRT